MDHGEPFLKFQWRLGVRAGLFGGILLGIFLWFTESLSGLQVYKLLMNVDYIPVLGKYTFPAPVEFLFHLIVSVVLSIVLLWLVRRMRMIGSRVTTWLMTVNVLIGLMIWPVTALSPRTPAMGDWMALALWLVGHAFYGGVLSVFYRRMDVKVVENE